MDWSNIFFLRIFLYIEREKKRERFYIIGFCFIDFILDFKMCFFLLEILILLKNFYII